MRIKSGVCCFCCLGALLASGCGEPVAPPPVSEEVAQEFEEQEQKEAEKKAAEEAKGDEYELKKAGAGATGKGQYGVDSDQPMSIVTVPVSTYFQAKEKAVFDMQIPQAMKLFQASEGRYPDSEAEFYQKIIQANMIQLPKLPEGDFYVYDVPNHTLMIRTKK